MNPTLQELRDNDAVRTFKMVAATIALITVGAVAVDASTGAEAPCLGHQAQAGDYLSVIARDNDTTVAELADLNGIGDPDLIRVGDCIRLPGVAGVVVLAPEVRETASGCSGGPTVGAVALRDGLLEQFGGEDLGIYNCRTSRGSSRAWSLHAEGRAFDLGWPSCDGLRQVAEQIVLRHQELGVQRVLGCDFDWRIGEGWSTPSDRLRALHDGRAAPVHLHVELGRVAAEALTLGMVREAFAPPPPVTPEDVAAVEIGTAVALEADGSAVEVIDADEWQG